MSAALSVRQLTVNYDKAPVLWDINFSVPAGHCVAIIGPNGAGKSTLLKAVLGMVTPLSGNVELFGLPIKKARQRIAYVPQRSSVDWDFPITAYDVVLMGRYGRLGIFKWPRTKDRRLAEEALKTVGMEAFAHRQISQLSGGQQQRLFIARALLQEADVYFMDEPFAGVDMASEKSIISTLNGLKAKGKTLFIVHHDLNSVEKYFDWVVMLNTSLIACGPVQEVFHEQNVIRTYGKSSFLLDEVAKLSKNKSSGLR